MNILAVDGGGIRGLIPGVVIREMEKMAYDYALEKQYASNPSKADDKIEGNFINHD